MMQGSLLFDLVIVLDFLVHKLLYRNLSENLRV